MEKVKLSLEELEVESFSVDDAEDDLGTVYAAEGPTGRTRYCPCQESVSCFAC